MVAGIHYIWHFFLLIVLICSQLLFIFNLDVVRMQYISVDFIFTTINTSCGFVQLATYKIRKLDFIALCAFNLLANAR